MPARFDALVRAASPLQSLLGIVRELRSGGHLSREAMLTHAALASLRRVPSATLGLDRIARSLAVSEVHLRRVVRGSAGFSPKQIQRIRRVDRAIASAERQTHPDWARIAGENGFYDQPHMIQEFQSITGCAPAQLFRERRLQDVIEISNPSPTAI
jgi:AraC-like DNA-binding protein